jgi:hypothetical protein
MVCWYGRDNLGVKKVLAPSKCAEKWLKKLLSQMGKLFGDEYFYLSYLFFSSLINVERQHKNFHDSQTVLFSRAMLGSGIARLGRPNRRPPAGLLTVQDVGGKGYRVEE